VIEGTRINARRIGAGSIHKAGIFAAAGVIALTDMVDRLIDDNRRATRLAKLLNDSGLQIDLATVQTNIVLATINHSAREFVAHLARHGVLALERSSHDVRFVTHRLIGDAEIERAAEVVAHVLKDMEAKV
jgi:threonine aldolase